MTPIPDAWSALIAGLLSGLLPALAVAGAAWVMLRLSPRTNAATRHAVWWLVLVLAVLLPLGFAAGGVSRMRVQARVPPVAPVFEPASPGVFVRRAAVSTPAVSAPSFQAAPLQLRAGGWSVWLAILWTGLFAAGLGRLGWSYRRLRGIKRRSSAAPPELSESFRKWTVACAIRRPVRLLVSDEVATPVAAGFRHPAVIVPGRVVGEFGKTELDHILLHELSHLARRDDWSNLFARAASAALWFNPAAVWALRRIEREREIACDEWVVAATGAPRPYAASLARLFEFCIAQRKEALAAGMAGHASQLGERIEVLVRGKGTGTRGVSMLRVAGCTAVLLVLAAAAARMPHWVVLAQNPPMAVRHAFQVDPRPMAQPVAVNYARPAGQHSFLAAVVEAGYGDLPVDDIILLRNSGVSAGYLMGISRAGWGKLKPREIVNLHNSGVSTDFLRAVGAAGVPGLTIQGVIDLHASGVTAQYVEGLQSAGLGAFPKERIIELHNSGVRPGLLAALREAGFTRLDTREIVDANNSRLCQRDLREAKRYGASLTLKQVLRLKQAGVL
jgi:beta-lactamase regulating signal transducer with metallopeptidase domain